jgi:hypothetical protein
MIFQNVGIGWRHQYNISDQIVSDLWQVSGFLIIYNGTKISFTNRNDPPRYNIGKNAYCGPYGACRIRQNISTITTIVVLDYEIIFYH